MARQSIILFGEGLTEAIFLNHLKNEFQVHQRMRVKVDKGRGKSPKDAANLLIRKYLQTGAFNRSLLFIDSDVPNNIPKKWLKDNNITLVMSRPKCVEGLMLSILGSLPKGGLHAQSQDLKAHFLKTLKTDERGYMIKLRDKCPQFFPRALLEKQRSSISELDELLDFLQV